jgi:hypothetical protein
MLNRRSSARPTPWQHLLDALIGGGLAVMVLIGTALLILTWPWQSLLVYLGVLLLAGIAAGIEDYTHYRAARGRHIPGVTTRPDPDPDPGAPAPEQDGGDRSCS